MHLMKRIEELFSQAENYIFPLYSDAFFRYNYPSYANLTK